MENLQAVCQILNEHSTRIFGYWRCSCGLYTDTNDFQRIPTGKDTTVDDLDFWYNPTYDNYFKLLNALEKLDEDVSDFRSREDPGSETVFFQTAAT